MRRNKVDVASIVPAIMAGATYREAIARFGISEVTYYKYRSLAGMARPSRRRFDDADLLRLFEEGKSRRDCAKALQCSESCVAIAARRLGLRWIRRHVPRAQWATWEDPKPGPVGVVPPDLFADIYAAFGCTGAANYLGLSPSAISQRAARLRSKGMLPARVGA